MNDHHRRRRDVPDRSDRRTRGARASGGPDSFLDGALDPESRHPGYWEVFQARTTRLAGPELARRRRMARVTVSDVVTAWSRTLVPVSMAAAAAALAVLYGDPGTVAAPDAAPPGVEQVLEEALDADPPPSIFGLPADEDLAVVAAEGL